MREVLHNVLFPQECLFLEKVRRNIIRDFGIEDTTIRFFGKNIEGRPKVIYAMKMPEKSQNDLPDSHITIMIERMGGGALIYADIFVPREEDVQKYVSLGKGLATAIALFRGQNDSFTVSALSQDVEAEDNSLETQIIVDAVSKWMDDDKEYQFWKKMSRPYLKWFFEEPDVRGMGRNMMIDIREAVRDIAKERGDSGDFQIAISVHEKLMNDAFGGLDEKNIRTNIAQKFWMNPEKQIILDSGMKGELGFDFAYERAEEQTEPLINIKVSIETIGGYDLGVYRIYQKGILLAIMPYIEIWRTFAGLNCYDCKTTILENSFSNS